MPTLLNHGDNAYEYPIGRTNEVSGGVAVVKTIRIPRASVKPDANGEAETVPGAVEVTDEELRMMRADDVAKHWFRMGKVSVADADAPPPAPPTTERQRAKARG